MIRSFIRYAILLLIYHLLYRKKSEKYNDCYMLSISSHVLIDSQHKQVLSLLSIEHGYLKTDITLSDA